LTGAVVTVTFDNAQPVGVGDGEGDGDGNGEGDGEADGDASIVEAVGCSVPFAQAVPVSARATRRPVICTSRVRPGRVIGAGSGTGGSSL
jgi:hypothetical protein